MARQTDLLSVDEAVARILKECRVLGAENVRLDDSLGRIAGSDCTSNMSIPPFANSSMDGFALNAADTREASRATPLSLRVVANIPAGVHGDSQLEAGTCARIMTGAPLPPGSDAVVPFEDVVDLGTTMQIMAPVRAGACVRPAGQDVHAGDTVLSRGREITSRDIALLAASGVVHIPVSRRPRVSIVVSGDELAFAGSELAPGQIYNSNGPMIRAAVHEAGGVIEADLIAGDTEESVSQALDGAAHADLVITSGGASVGDRDHMRSVLENTGEVLFWRVRVRPGKPFLLARYSSTLVLALPGNPASAAVTFEIFARPAIRAMLGAPVNRPRVDVVLDEGVDNRGGRRTYVRASLRVAGTDLHAYPAGGQDSAMLAPLARADALIEIPEDRERVEAGSVVSALIWRLPLS